MSSGSIDKCQPNLIPMLDLILQLIMFFMLVTNFISDDLNASIRLPKAIQARPIDKSELYVIMLNVDKLGRVLLMKGNEKEVEALLAKSPNGQSPLVLTNKIEVRDYMRIKYEGDTARIDREKTAGAKVEPRYSLVVLRAHEEATYKMVDDVLQGCRMAGYTDVQLRAIATAGR